MGKRGTKPTPTNTLEARGSWRAKARGKDGEPEPAVEVPPPPEWLSDRATAEYWHIVPQLEGLGLISGVYQVPLALYCQAMADYLETKALVKEHGWIITTETGRVIEHPAVGIMHKAWERCLKAAREFGMTPSAMSGVRPVKKDEPQKKKKGRFFAAG